MKTKKYGFNESGKNTKRKKNKNKRNLQFKQNKKCDLNEKQKIKVR